MDLFLNKIDPQLVRQVKETTATGIVHKKDDVPIHEEDKDREEEKRKKKRDIKTIKEKVKKINDLAESKGLDIFFTLEAENFQLWIKVFEKNSDKCIRTFDENEIEEILNRMENLSGIIVDVKR